jgi:hypothetical protein
MSDIFGSADEIAVVARQRWYTASLCSQVEAQSMQHKLCRFAQFFSARFPFIRNTAPIYLSIACFLWDRLKKREVLQVLTCSEQLALAATPVSNLQKVIIAIPCICMCRVLVRACFCVGTYVLASLSPCASCVYLRHRRPS